MRLRRKISVAFFLVSSLVSVVLAVLLYRFIEAQLEEELRARLRDITHLGSTTIDPDAYARLEAELGGALDPDAVDRIERSADYRRITERLDVMRATEPELIKYVYILRATDDPAAPRFVVDADVTTLIDDPDATDDDISHFAEPYDVADKPELMRALAECVPVVEDRFVWDDEFGVNSVSAYYPITARGDGPCAVLGIDITDKNMRAALDEALWLAILISIGVIGFALVVSITMGTILTRSLTALSSTVQRFAEKDFNARTRIATRDEIGQLGESFNVMAETIQAHSENLEHLVHQRTSELYAEKQTSERLLLNVLPARIAERLKHGDGIIVDRFDQVSVLFADIVGFTALSQRTSPEALVTMLDELFSVFDRLAEEHGLEKIKTIGDAYMVVAGIPEPAADHAQRIAGMALDMLDALRRYSERHGTDLTIRIGVNTGSVVAGVIGRKKFIYDLWGDTVNTASRMESHGVPGRIHVTESTVKALEAEFEFEARGVIDIKGKGPMPTYLLVGRKAAATSASPPARGSPP